MYIHRSTTKTARIPIASKKTVEIFYILFNLNLSKEPFPFILYRLCDCEGYEWIIPFLEQGLHCFSEIIYGHIIEQPPKSRRFCCLKNDIWFRFSENSLCFIHFMALRRAFFISYFNLFHYF